MINLQKLTETIKQGRTKLWLPVSIVLLLLLAFGLYQQQMNAAAKPEWQKLRIAYAIEPPYAYFDESQRVTGESPESARQIAAMLGVKDIEWLQLPFAELIPALQNRQVDLIAAGMFINRQRQNQVRFSIPTLQTLAAGQPQFRVITLDSEASKRLSADYVAYAFHRENTTLLHAWNRAMQQWLGSDDHLKTITRFGFERRNIAITNSR